VAETKAGPDVFNEANAAVEKPPGLRGSGKLGSPLARMQRANFSAFANNQPAHN
jgi:hypothetical protein